jgi:hypothetical protein
MDDTKVVIASDQRGRGNPAETLDCFVARTPRNDDHVV